MENNSAKLKKEIQDFLNDKALEKYEDLKLVTSGQNDEGANLIELAFKDVHFGMILQEFQNLKITWYFYEPLTDNELRFWKSKYDFKFFDVPNKEYNIALSILKIKQDAFKEGIKVMMYGTMKSLRRFKIDFKWIVMMAKNRQNFREEFQ